MDEVIASTRRGFTGELKKDLPFFSLSGILIGIFMVIHTPAKDAGLASEKSWANELFSDFVSFQVYGLMLIGGLILGSAAVCISRLGIPFNIFHDSAEHIKLRLTQVTSSIVAFTFGLSLVSGSHSWLTGSVQGAALALLMVSFNLMLVLGLFSSACFLHFLETTKRKYVPYVSLLLSLLSLIYMVFWGVPSAS